MLLRLGTRRIASPSPCVACWRRSFWTPPATLEHRHPAFKHFAENLAPLPEFRTRGRDVRILYDPADFYQSLLVRLELRSRGPEGRTDLISRLIAQHRIAHARRRIFIASLYVGKEEVELVRWIPREVSSRSGS